MSQYTEADDQTSSTLPPVSIIVIAKDEEKTIGKCISSIIRQDYPSLEIIFVDSSSTDQTLSIVESYTGSHRPILIATSKANASAARNAGIRLAHSPIVAFVDGDSYLDELWLRRAVTYLQDRKDDHVAGVGGPFVQVPSERTPTTMVISQVESTTLGRGGSTRSHEARGFRPAKSLSLSAAVFWLDIVRPLGFFDEKLRYCEDAEFCQRIRMEGYTLLSFYDLGAYHTPKYNTLRAFAVKMWSYGVGRGRAVRHHWKLMTAVGSASIAYLIALCTLLFFGFIMGYGEAKLLAILFGGLYFVAITISSLTIAYRQASVRSFFLGIAGYLALHIAYTIGLMVGMIAPER
jgi:glycosyltransferase involved in cell wall biosynthesis